MSWGGWKSPVEDLFCSWISLPQPPQTPFVAAYRRRFELDTPAMVNLHVTADERYELFLDGRRLGRGPERGDAFNWYFESYPVELSAGEHVLVAKVWSLGRELAPTAQMSVRHGLLVATGGEADAILATGVAEWEGMLLAGRTFAGGSVVGATGPRECVDGSRYAWGVENGEGEGWTPVEVAEPARSSLAYTGIPGTGLHALAPALLPPMLSRIVTTGTVRHADAAANTSENTPCQFAMWGTPDANVATEDTESLYAAKRQRALAGFNAPLRRRHSGIGRTGN
jgi:hypothetical protein